MSIHPIEGRYGSEEMREIWRKRKELEYMLKVEAALARAEAEYGLVPDNAADEIEDKANLSYVSLERVKEIEAEIKHDIMAVVKALSEQCEDGHGEYVHLGATSNDISDTTRALQFKESLKIIMRRLRELETSLIEKADRYRELACVGRTHGQHAVPTTLGHKFAIYASEIRRHIDRINELKPRILVGQLTGAVGTQASLGDMGEKVHQRVNEILGLNPVVISSQVIQRDRYAELITKLALISGTLDKISKEVRNLQRTEISELQEPFGEKQVGSSTMPQKKNPMRSERVGGLAKVVRGNVQTELENIPLEHERDLTNSSSERIVLPETFLLVDEQLKLMNYIIQDLVVNEENIKNVLGHTGGLNMSESIMMALFNKGLGRQTAHEIVRDCAMDAYESEKTFKEALIQHQEVQNLMSIKEIEEALEPSNYLGCAEEHIDNVIDIYKKEKED
ncbi:adenylosuccinate lyase [Methanonatronarchaeum sp. AMET6-2]|uniref:adenylosuccinate lyase n=1 Tax=Methanonatronarchaeum sp. AMET6-2 TaxID=2933293 RepID=UPI0011F4370D|nr:adenylosuccinate lyase [Methanonatronarchaeum sp. AMET6-2]RZN62238.1 MAG: adenylosuccinate lyase [Methanonatronarchaeia archaeon]UOY10426.1 adenylosuccinate lyase [Methanonatronarchaeum sp. AMET6-2]